MRPGATQLTVIALRAELVARASSASRCSAGPERVREREVVGRLLRGERRDRDDARRRRSARDAAARAGRGGRRARASARAPARARRASRPMPVPAGGPPEFQTRMSSPPKASIVCATARSRSCGSVTSPRTASAPRRSASRSSTSRRAREHRHVRAFGGQRLGAREAEAGRRAADEGGAAFQSEIHGGREYLRGAAEAAFGVDHLAGDPAPVVAAEPRDEARRVVGLAPAPERHARRRVELRRGPSRCPSGRG